MTAKPVSWRNASATELRKIRGVCLDIDDTLSTEGKLTASAFAALWALRDAGFAVVPVTGRPAGWCDHIARFWPVDAVVGENGAFTFFMKDGVRKRIDTPCEAPPEARRARLAELRTKIRMQFPEAVWASDQAYREFDLAIDICEDVSPWREARVTELLEFCKGAGAHAKLSSIHVNTWFGNYDKVSGFAHWFGKSLETDHWLFIGDSPNDEPMFRNFKASVGVANLTRYLDRLTYPPRWITRAKSGEGFAEMARKLIQSRKGRRR